MSSRLAHGVIDARYSRAHVPGAHGMHVQVRRAPPDGICDDVGGFLEVLLARRVIVGTHAAKGRDLADEVTSLEVMRHEHHNAAGVIHEVEHPGGHRRAVLPGPEDLVTQLSRGEVHVQQRLVVLLAGGVPRNVGQVLDGAVGPVAAHDVLRQHVLPVAQAKAHEVVGLLQRRHAGIKPPAAGVQPAMQQLLEAVLRQVQRPRGRHALHFSADVQHIRRRQLAPGQRRGPHEAPPLRLPRRLLPHGLGEARRASRQDLHAAGVDEVGLRVLSKGLPRLQANGLQAGAPQL
eukprot:scaffold7092_cov262-Pinguiococcus_pyrenoidosus.AAC.31